MKDRPCSGSAAATGTIRHRVSRTTLYDRPAHPIDIFAPKLTLRGPSLPDSSTEELGAQFRVILVVFSFLL